MISISIPRKINTEDPDSMNDTFPSRIIPIGGKIIKVIKIIRNNQGDNFMTSNDELSIEELDALEQELPEDIENYTDENELELDEIPDEEAELDEFPATDNLDPNDADSIEEEDVDEFTKDNAEEEIDASELDEEDDFSGLDG